MLGKITSKWWVFRQLLLIFHSSKLVYILENWIWEREILSFHQRKIYLTVCLFFETNTAKKSSFPLRISSVMWQNPQETANFVTLTIKKSLIKNSLFCAVQWTPTRNMCITWRKLLCLVSYPLLNVLKCFLKKLLRRLFYSISYK